eukprot:2613533-Pyramimonas_sp.AAC.1
MYNLFAAAASSAATPSSNPDSFAHYLVCKRMWHQLSLPRGRHHQYVLARLGLHDVNYAINGDPDNYIDHVLARMAVAYRAYHNIKDMFFLGT